MSKSNVQSKKHPRKKYPTIAACGLDCGLCPRYYTAGPSRCPGCGGPDFHLKHPTCSFITCCVKDRHLEVCGECPEFPCAKFKSAREYERIFASPSYASPRKILPNLYFIKRHGIRKFLVQQNKRMALLQTMMREFDDGRSRSFFCRAANLHDPKVLAGSIRKAATTAGREGIKRTDKKSRAKILRALIDEIPLTA